MTRALRIDAHHHFWDPAQFHYPWMEGAALDPVRRPFTPDDLAPELARNDIDGTVLVQTVSDLSETRGFLDLARDTPFVYGVVGWADLTSAQLGETLSELAGEYGRTLVGIRHQVHDEGDPRWLERDDVVAGIRTLADHQLAYDLLVRTRELPSAVSVVAALPDQRFVLDHIAKPPIAEGWSDSWATELALLAALPNVSVKLSGMVTEAKWDSWTPETLSAYVVWVVELFGTDRIMFGSDWPVCLLAARNYSEVVDALADVLVGLSAAETAAVFGGNAATWYDLVPVE
ncbi:amidohydrolase family protein [Diaminobutyricibacter tongyongensis]|uniref:Amidohydrolase family protein n=1 Tax=Leifsonia tongyongensis TaxID=1268043 RepID=A0A6L9XV46_9MICO|nr:amidohydrolase family protein [Diaminobutyricibacter tongyongensis]NEN05300.1 amidohydrolase family protein [Diaminobutyricibacter tongyongensis]